jgi:hypothetical protein|tara:strand:+ start:487 stop:975 length:489 start_codon:yes stop_codon:yes gene_type:complete
MQILNNFLDKKKFQEIKDLIFSDSFPFYFNDSIVGKNVDQGKDFMFNHMFYSDDQQRSNHFNYVLMPILGRLNFNHLLRAKLNCYTKKNKFIHTPFHTDSESPHTVALFSLNTCNGYTYFKDTKEKIQSVENQVVIFNGLREHCSVAQTDTHLRVNININLI